MIALGAVRSVVVPLAAALLVAPTSGTGVGFARPPGASAIELEPIPSAPVARQESRAPTMERREALMRVATEIMRAAGNCALITVDESGHPQARAMDPFPPEPDLTVWMATNRTTRKVKELMADPRVTLYYFDPAGPGYVTLRGEASLIEDPVERDRLWKPEWDAFYVDANRGDDYALIRFRPHRVEIVSLPHGVASDPMAWRPAILDLRQ